MYSLHNYENTTPKWSFTFISVISAGFPQPDEGCRAAAGPCLKSTAAQPRPFLLQLPRASKSHRFPFPIPSVLVNLCGQVCQPVQAGSAGCVVCIEPARRQETRSHVLTIRDTWWTWKEPLWQVGGCGMEMPWGAEVSRSPQEFLRTGRLVMFSVSIACEIPQTFPCRAVKRWTALEVHESFAQQVQSLLSQYNVLGYFLRDCYVKMN